MNKFKQINLPINIINSENLIKINTRNVVDVVEDIIRKYKFTKTKNTINKWHRFYNNFDKDFGVLYKNIYYPEFLIKNSSFLRVNRSFYFTQNSLANLNILNWIMLDFLKKNEIQNIKKCTILELGSGYGYNLVNIIKNFKNIQKVIASDYSKGGLIIAKKNFERNKIKNFETRIINYNNIKDFSFKSKIDVVFTRHALEQNENCKDVIKNILNLSPKIVINIEPIVDYYNKNNKFDIVASKYHLKRGYLKNYISQLKSNQNVKILNSGKYNFGNMFNDSCGVVAWTKKIN